MSAALARVERPLSWDEQLEAIMAEASRALDEGDFEAAYATMSSFTLTDTEGREQVPLERLMWLRQRHDELGERMRSAQHDLRSAMGKMGASQRAVKAYRRR